MIHRHELSKHSAFYSYLYDHSIEMVVITPFMLRKRTADWLILEFTSDQDCCHPRFSEYLRIVTQDLSNYMLRSVAEFDLLYLAYHDQLTGLMNRTHFLQQADERLASPSQGKISAILFIDVDAFKDINDTAGHDTGNRVISAVAERMRSAVRPEDALARYGGDEFIILAARDSVDEVEDVAQAVLDALRDPVIVDAWSFNVTASVGIALYPEHGRKATELLNNADFAMYEAKYAGKNRMSLYVPENKNAAHNNYLLKNSLSRAIEHDELVVFYQPQVAIEDARIVGAEALVRWNHPSLGRISPAAFIPIAEATGLIVDIGAYVLREACRTGAELARQGFPIRVGVNFSYQQVIHPDFLDLLTRTLLETQLAPSQLEVEITESTTGK